MNVVILSRRFLTKRDSNICMYFIHELNITITRIIEIFALFSLCLLDTKISPVGTGAIFQLLRPPPICGGGGAREVA